MNKCFNCGKENPTCFAYCPECFRQQELVQSKDKQLTDISALLKQRGTVHGSFQENADRTCALISALGPKYHTLPTVVRFSLYMLLGKVARIVSGDCTFHDHWEDIEGYAIKTLEALNIVREKNNIKLIPCPRCQAFIPLTVRGGCCPNCNGNLMPEPAEEIEDEQ